YYFRIYFVFVKTCISSITTKKEPQGYPPPRCCVTILEKIPRRILRLVSRCEIQSKYGACHIDALILHIRNKLFCAHPRLLKKLKKIHESQPVKPFCFCFKVRNYTI
uniref:Chemokine interleukin-8-like domain-containing protein n=1 Tax=Sinocyclocheilus anshuiensis TaxID=1608454 RepID=A0A671MET1_9TELE